MEGLRWRLSRRDIRVAEDRPAQRVRWRRKARRGVGGGKENIRVAGDGQSRNPRVEPFDRHWRRYEDWFDTHRSAYHAELRALRELVSHGVRGVEVGVGSGRFAVPLEIPFGVDPSLPMVKLARERGIHVVQGVGEALPFAGSSFDLVLMATTVCFLEDLDRTLQEARRVLRIGGAIVVGLVDRASPLGAEYLARKDESLFYRGARFRTADEVLASLARAGFGEFDARQTLFGSPGATPPDEPVLEGHGTGSFVALRGRALDHGSDG